jgi:CTP:molybdopterin cytidylyltransferase MocA
MSASAEHVPATPSVSVVIPAYNYARFLPTAIETALAQETGGRVEVVVVDDGSTDETPQILAGFGDRIVAIRQANGGLNSATSAGIAAATGDYITFLDADDAWRPGRLRILLDAFVRNPGAVLVWGDMEIVDADGGPLAPSMRAASRLDTPAPEHVLGRLLVKNCISAGSMMFPAALRDAVAPVPDGVPYQDWWIALQAACLGPCVAIPDSVNLYRHHGANMNLGVSRDKIAGLAEIELPFRRSLLTGVEPGDVLGEDLIDALDYFDRVGSGLAGYKRLPLARIHGLTGEDRERAVAELQLASGQLDAGEHEAAFFSLCRAIAHDPLWDVPRTLFTELAPFVAARTTALPIAA